MSPTARRAFIALDEWLGVLLLLWLRGKPEFWPAFAGWFVAVYCVSYPCHWLLLWKGK